MTDGPPLVPPGRRRLIGLALTAYGLVGLVLIGSAGFVVGRAIEGVDALAVSVAGQRDSLAHTLRTTAVSLDRAATGVGAVASSLDAANDSSTRAAALARSLSGTLDALARAMDVSVFGTRPFVELAVGFETAARQSEALADSLEEVSRSLATNDTHLQASRHDLEALAQQVDGLARSVTATPLEGGPPPFLVELAFLGLVAWLAVPALVSTVVGVAVLRRSG